MDKADKLDLKQSTRRPFKSRDLAFSREVNRQGERNWAILWHLNTQRYLDFYVIYRIKQYIRLYTRVLHPGDISDKAINATYSRLNT